MQKLDWIRTLYNKLIKSLIDWDPRATNNHCGKIIGIHLASHILVQCMMIA